MQNITPKLLLMFFNGSILFAITSTLILGFLSHAINIYQAEKFDVRIIQGVKIMYIDDSDENCPEFLRSRIRLMRKIFYVSIASLSLMLMAGISLQKTI